MPTRKKPETLQKELTELNKGRKMVEGIINKSESIIEMTKTDGWKIYLGLLQTSLNSIQNEMDKHESMDEAKRIRVLQKNKDYRDIIKLSDFTNMQLDGYKERLRDINARISKRKQRMELYGPN